MNSLLLLEILIHQNCIKCCCKSHPLHLSFFGVSVNYTELCYPVRCVTYRTFSVLNHFHFISLDLISSRSTY